MERENAELVDHLGHARAYQIAVEEKLVDSQRQLQEKEHILIGRVRDADARREHDRRKRRRLELDILVLRAQVEEGQDAQVMLDVITGALFV